MWEYKKFTGSKNIKDIDTITNLNNYNYITLLKDLNNGNDAVGGYVNPWNDEVKLDGQENIFFKDDNNQIKIFIRDLCKSLPFNKTEDEYNKEGLRVENYVFDNSFFNKKNNKIFYNLYHNNVHNNTSIFDAPIFVSKYLFLDSEQNLEKIDILDKQGNKLLPDKKHDLKLKIEPNTGVPFGLDLSLMINIEIKSNDLVNHKDTIWFPIFSLNINFIQSEKFYDTNLKLIVNYFWFIKNSWWMLLIIILLYITIFMIIRIKKNKKSKLKESLLCGKYEKELESEIKESKEILEDKKEDNIKLKENLNLTKKSLKDETTMLDK